MRSDSGDWLLDERMERCQRHVVFTHQSEHHTRTSFPEGKHYLVKELGGG